MKNGGLFGMSLWLLLSVAQGAEIPTDAMLQLQVGHWVELRGALDQRAQEFCVERIELLEPEKHEYLVGTARAPANEQNFELLGQRIKVSKKTQFEQVDASEIDGMQVKVVGYFRGPGRFSAREVSPRNGGRERIMGRIDAIRHNDAGTVVHVMGLRAHADSKVNLRHQRPLSQYALSEPRLSPIVRETDDDDRFGDGAQLGQWGRLSMQSELRSTEESDFDLDAEDQEDRLDNTLSVRARLVLSPSHKLTSLIEARHSQLFRRDDEDGRFSRGDTRLGEAYVYLRGIHDSPIDVQLGRQDFDDEREWLYDENLDGVRVIWQHADFRAEVAHATVLFGGDQEDRDTRTTIAYIAHEADRRHAGAYAVRRARGGLEPLRTTHVGIRANGEWATQAEGWFELARVEGERELRQFSAWGYDLGLTYKIGERANITVGFATGEGQVTDGRDSSFIQTGLQDNNGKFAGVTSFRYYGELFDPQLSNLRVITVGAGYRMSQASSVDLIWHRYRQDLAYEELFDTEIDDDPNGLYPDLGSELDLVLGLRLGNWDAEVVAAWFRPGRAFEHRDSATLTKFQLRYRY